MDMFKDPGAQTYAWTGFSAFMSWFNDYNNLTLLSLAIGIVTALINAYSKCSEGQMRKREEERKEELHRARMARLKMGLPDETFED